MSKWKYIEQHIIYFEGISLRSKKKINISVIHSLLNAVFFMHKTSFLHKNYLFL